MDIAAEDRRRLKIGLKANRLEMDPPLSTPTRQTSGRGNNHIAPASLEEDLIHAKREEEKLKATIEALEREKRQMNAIVALMERKDLYEFFVRGHRTLQDEVDRTDKDTCYSSLCEGLKAAVGTLPNSLAVFDYMRSIFDSYVNPTNDPNVQPLVKGLDADDFSVDKFLGLQDPTTPDDVQAGTDFEEDL
ncbi:hypothetical protein R1flu_000346 [Riccia fluitans]|uniref:Uncharacterized protein n=1 Tax=Riccia fluitans TaxID=41844 RepID=A0ABD1Y063_9MARC